MGAALSCVALPALGTVGAWAASCFSAAACSLACKRYVYENCHKRHCAKDLSGVLGILVVTATIPLLQE
jgi:hypothetical protein